MIKKMKLSLLIITLVILSSGCGTDTKENVADSKQDVVKASITWDDKRVAPFKADWNSIGVTDPVFVLGWVKFSKNEMKGSDGVLQYKRWSRGGVTDYKIAKRLFAICGNRSGSLDIVSRGVSIEKAESLFKAGTPCDSIK